MEHDRIINLRQVCSSYNVEVNFIRTLHEYGLVEIIREAEDDFIDKESLAEIETLMHLHYDLEINMEGIDAISHMLKRVREMQKELTQLRNRLS